MQRTKLIRITTVPISLDKLLGKQLSYMNQYYQVTAVSANQPELERVAEKYGVAYHHVEMTRAITPLKDGAAVLKLYCYLRAQKPHIVHSHTPKAGLVGMMAAFFAGVPIRMHTVAGLPLLEATGLKRAILNGVEKLTCAFATKVYPNSFAMRDIMVNEGFCAPGKLKVLANGSSNGIDSGYFSTESVSAYARQGLREELGIKDEDFVFIFVGRLVGDKGINELVTAFKNIASAELSDRDSTALITHDPKGMGGVKLLLVGPLEHALYPLLAQTQTEIDSNPHVISMGYQQDVRPYFAISDALVFPSYREGFPNVVLQAGAMELPAIVTDINGCNEIIEEGKNGLIIPVKDAAALQQAMEKLATDGTLYHKLRENARPLIESRYQQSAVWKALLEEYQANISALSQRRVISSTESI